MNDLHRKDDALDALLRASAPERLLDDGFVSRTMAGVDRAAGRRPAPRRLAPAAIARALVTENRRHAAQARRWRWAMAGVGTGLVLMLVAVAVSPEGVTLEIPPPSQWASVALLAMAGALGVAWRSLRDN